MKHPYKTYLAILSLGLLLVGCSRFDAPLVIDGEGTWNILSKTTHVEENSVVVVDMTETTNLGQVLFERSGRGIFIDASANRDTITWDESLTENRLVMYSRTGPWMNCAVTKRTNKSMTLDWENANDIGTVHRVLKGTLVIERQK